MNWLILWYKRASQIEVVIKNQPANAGDIRDMGSIPGSGRSPGGRHGNPLQFLAWRIPWIVKPGRLRPIGSQRVGHNRSDLINMHACGHISSYRASQVAQW